jgi:hypothetical protein
MAELVDALVSGTSDESRGGSSPLQGTNYFFPSARLGVNCARGNCRSWTAGIWQDEFH